MHAARRFLENMDDDSVLVKIDFSNAFNSLFRDRMLLSLYTILPELAAFCSLAYSEPSNLKYGAFSVLSQVGPQQGDPLGPLLFCLPLQPILAEMTSPLTLGFLDDLTLGGNSQVVADDVVQLELKCRDLGLHLNHSKCEVISRSPGNLEGLSQLSFFTRTNPREASLLGAPLSTQGALDEAWGPA